MKKVIYTLILSMLITSSLCQFSYADEIKETTMNADTQNEGQIFLEEDIESSDEDLQIIGDYWYSEETWWETTELHCYTIVRNNSESDMVANCTVKLYNASGEVVATEKDDFGGVGYVIGAGETSIFENTFSDVDPADVADVKSRVAGSKNATEKEDVINHFTYVAEKAVNGISLDMEIDNPPKSLVEQIVYVYVLFFKDGQFIDADQYTTVYQDIFDYEMYNFECNDDYDNYAVYIKGYQMHLF